MSLSAPTNEADAATQRQRPRLVLAIPAYNAAKTVPAVLERIPGGIWDWTQVVIVVNDGSTDDTAQVLAGLCAGRPSLQVITHSGNRGYGGTCKTGLRAALDAGADLVAWVHGDGQYAPEELPRLLAPLASGQADLVQGSRFCGSGLGVSARAGGMPRYKLWGNLALSALERAVYRLPLAEFHSGYMLYHRRSLEAVPFEQLSEDFTFDQEFLLSAHLRGLRIQELPIPTQYADESSHLRVIPYGLATLRMIWRYWRGWYSP